MTALLQPQSDEISWVDQQTGEWRAQGFFRVIDSRVECVSLTLARGGGDEARPILWSELRNLRGGEIIDELRRQVADVELTVRTQAEQVAPPGDAHLSYRSPFENRGRRGPRSRGEAHFVEVAIVYAEAAWSWPDPTEAVREYFEVSKSTASKWVGRCRPPDKKHPENLDLLTAAPGPGKAGGELTEHGRRLAAAAESQTKKPPAKRPARPKGQKR